MLTSEIDNVNAISISNRKLTMLTSEILLTSEIDNVNAISISNRKLTMLTSEILLTSEIDNVNAISISNRKLTMLYIGNFANIGNWKIVIWVVYRAQVTHFSIFRIFPRIVCCRFGTVCCRLVFSIVANLSWKIKNANFIWKIENENIFPFPMLTSEIDNDMCLWRHYINIVVSSTTLYHVSLFCFCSPLFMTTCPLLAHYLPILLVHPYSCPLLAHIIH